MADIVTSPTPTYDPAALSDSYKALLGSYGLGPLTSTSASTTGMTDITKYPGYDNLMRMLSGQLQPGTVSMLTQYGAERGVGQRGLGATAPAIQTATLKDLGITGEESSLKAQQIMAPLWQQMVSEQGQTARTGATLASQMAQQQLQEAGQTGRLGTSLSSEAERQAAQIAATAALQGERLTAEQANLLAQLQSNQDLQSQRLYYDMIQSMLPYYYGGVGGTRSNSGSGGGSSGSAPGYSTTWMNQPSYDFNYASQTYTPTEPLYQQAAEINQQNLENQLLQTQMQNAGLMSLASSMGLTGYNDILRSLNSLGSFPLPMGQSSTPSYSASIPSYSAPSYSTPSYYGTGMAGSPITSLAGIPSSAAPTSYFPW